MINKSILIVDDDVHILHAAHLFLKRHFANVDTEKNPLQIPFIMNNRHYDVILLDMNFNRNINTGVEGFQWLDFILDQNPNQKVILFTAFGDVEMAVRAIKNGAKDFLLKPWENDKMLATFHAALDHKPELQNKESAIIGESIEMKKILALVKQVAPTDANILILGENGTGKDLLAKEIHSESLRAQKPFVHADLGSITESLFESELFGHVKGAFTDAKEDRKGRFTEAEGGTLFLDEIGNIPLTIQSKLLYSLQNKSYIKVGSNKEQKIDARIVCATNADIYKKVEEKTFRQDLLYRINTIEIKLPPLRERGDDILLLTELFFNQYKNKYQRKLQGMSSAFEKKLMTYHWPGNIRELQHAIERAVILSTGQTLKDDALDSLSLRQDLNTLQSTFQIEEMEKDLIIKALTKNNGNITDAAKTLGLSRQALYRRIEKFNL